MNNRLSTERKYNIRHNHFAVPAYILSFVLIVITLRTIWAIFSNLPSINSETFFWILIFFAYISFFYVVVYVLGIGVKKNNNSYGIGSYVEELVGVKLSSLGDDYLVIHDIQKGKKMGNIDHVVIGPTGVFVIESKANRNKMIYYKNNIRKFSKLAEQFMNQVARDSLWIHNVIKDKLNIDIFVHGIVVRPLNEDKKIETYCKNRVCIMDGDSVYEHIKNFSGRLNFEEINKINVVLCEVKRNNY